MNSKLVLIALVAVFCAVQVSAQKKSVCYYFATIPVTQINPRICTHLIFSFFGLDAYGNIDFMWRSEADVAYYLAQMNAMKFQNPNLKVLVAIGGYNEPLIPAWYQMAENADRRNNFANNALRIVRDYNIDGVDIDWEYPNYDGNRPQDKANFVYLLQDLKRVLGSYLVTTAIGAGAWRTDLSYDLWGIFNAVDFVNVMTYDLHGGWTGITGIHGALYRSNLDPTDSNVDASVRLILNAGIDRNKLIMGIATYGNAFRLYDPNNNGVGAGASGDGSLTYYQICSAVNGGQMNYRWDNDQKVPYAFAGTQWVGYENLESVTEKSHYINNMGLGGSMYWAVDNDDYNGICGNGQFPLISRAYSIVVG